MEIYFLYLERQRVKRALPAPANSKILTPDNQYAMWGISEQPALGPNNTPNEKEKYQN